MASKKTQIDQLSYDWDDTELVAAYEKGLREISKDKNKPNAKNSKPAEPKWKVGSFCRAMYSEDNRYYEAKIINLWQNKCSVEFLGYGNEETVLLKALKDSLGKKSRKKQIKKSSVDYETTEGEESSFSVEDELTTTEDATDMDIRKRHARRENSNFNVSQMTRHTNGTVPFACEGEDKTFHPHRAVSHLPYHSFPVQTNPHHCGLPSPSYDVMAAHAPHDIPFPPVPPCPEIASSPSVAAMLSAWYMAGYYTGLNQAEKKCKKCCCCHG